VIKFETEQSDSKGETSMPSLQDARKGKIEDFIKEHEADPDGDLDKLDAMIKRPTQGSGKVTRPASPQESSDD
jgi:hypothetical protein